MATVESAERIVSLPPVIETRLQDVRRRESRLRLFTGLIDATALFLAVMLVALVCDWAFTLFSTEVRLLLTLGTVAAGIVGLLLLAFLPQFKRRSLSEVAADVDRSVSAMEERWQTVAELSTSKDSLEVAGSPAMARRVVGEAIARERLVDSRAVISNDTLKKHQWFLVAAIAALVVLFLIDGPQAWVLVQRFLQPTAQVSLTQVTAERGNFAVPRGEPVRLEANISRRAQTKAELFLRDASGSVSSLPLEAADKGGNRFVYSIDSAEKPFEYRFRSGDGETAWHQVTVHERPTLSKVDFRIVPPEYTKLPAVEKQELPSSIRAVEGSELEIVFTADQPLEQFRLDFGSNESATLAESATNPQQYLFRTTLNKTIRLTPALLSRNGLENLRPPSCQVIVYADRAPQVQIVTPDKEITVRPDDLVTVEIAARDDFEVTHAELIAYVGDEPDMENAVVVNPTTELPPATVDGQNATVDGQPVETQLDGKQPATDATQSPTEVSQDPAQSTTDGTQNVNPSATDGQTPKDEAGIAKTKDSATDASAKPSASDNASQEAGKATEQNANSQPSKDATSSANKNSQNPTTSPNSNAQNASSNPKSSNAQPNQANPNANSMNAQTGNTNASAGNANPAEPPKTVVIPFSLAGAKDPKNVRAKVNLDLKQFQLKTGQQIQYKVRVVDSRNTSAQNSKSGNNAQARTGDMVAQNDAARNGNATGKAGDSQKMQPGDAQKTQPGANNQGGNNSGNKSADPQNPAAGGPNAAANAANVQPNGGAANANQNAGNPQNPSSAQGNANPQNANGQNNSGQNNNGQNNNGGQNNSGQNNANKANAANNSSNAQNSSSGNNDQKNSSSQNSDPNDAQGGMTGAPRPQDGMTKRDLDVEQQSTSSSAMMIHIDEWAGSFKGQQREKLEILIDPVLKELDAVLAKSLEQMAPPAGVLQESKPLDDENKKSLHGAETLIERGQTLVADLVKKTADTPYAFVGLQLVDITELHVAPARVELKAVATDAADKQLAHVNQAQFHVTRAREMLADLNKKYESVKRDAKLAEKMERISKMYQVFLENVMAFMQSPRPSLNNKSAGMAELDLDEEFLERYTELLKQFNAIEAELAKALADDPRLLQRYMNGTRRSADTLRDQLTKINMRQQVLVPVVDRLNNQGEAGAKAAEKADGPKANVKPKTTKNVEKDDSKDENAEVGQPAEEGAKENLSPANIVRGSLQMELGEISVAAAELQENLKTWLPKAVNADDPRVAGLLKQSTALATAAEQSAALAASERFDEAAKKMTEITPTMAEFEQGLVKLAEDKDALLVANANRRLASLRRMQSRSASWLEKNTHLKEGRVNRAIEVDQHRLSEDTLELAGKLDGLQAQFAALPQDILEMAGTLQEILRFDALVDEMQAELTLRDEDLLTALDHQRNAVKNLTRAEEQFDKLIDRVIEENNKVPPQVPDLDQIQVPTLEQLLAQLEAEQDAAEALGIPTRGTNLTQIGDLLRRMNPGSGIGARGNQQMNMVNQARQNALRSIQKANVPDGEKLSNKNAGRWNKLSSRLDDILRQGRGNQPPKQYRRAIEKYFEDISGADGKNE